MGDENYGASSLFSFRTVLIKTGFSPTKCTHMLYHTTCLPSMDGKQS